MDIPFLDDVTKNAKTIVLDYWISIIFLDGPTKSQLVRMRQFTGSPWQNLVRPGRSKMSALKELVMAKLEAWGRELQLDSSLSKCDSVD